MAATRRYPGALHRTAFAALRLTDAVTILIGLAVAAITARAIAQLLSNLVLVTGQQVDERRCRTARSVLQLDLVAYLVATLLAAAGMHTGSDADIHRQQ